jgi:hypothetical protein
MSDLRLHFEDVRARVADPRDGAVGPDVLLYNPMSARTNGTASSFFATITLLPPLNIAMESLLWQESMKHPPVLLGSAPSFVTNRTSPN